MRWSALILLLILAFVGCDAQVTGLKIKPSELDFGQTYLGDTEEMFITVKNVSNTAYTISEIKIYGMSANDFYISSGGISSQYLVPNKLILITVVYRPTTAGIHRAFVQITHSGDKRTERIDLTGTGVAVARIETPSSEIDFGTVYLSRSNSMELVFKNVGTSILNITNLSFSNTSSTEFALKSGYNLPIRISPGDSDKVEIDFTPTADTYFSNNILIAHNAVNVDSPLSIKLFGDGLAFDPEIQLNQVSPWDFGTIAITLPVIADLEISSIGIDPLTVTNISMTNGTDFTFDHIEDSMGNSLNLPVQIQPGTKVIAKIKFAPTTLTTYNDSIIITHDAINENIPLSLDVKGTGRNEVSKTFNYTGSAQSWTVPAGVSFVYVECYGAEGGQPNGHAVGGKGGLAKAKVPVTPGDTVHVYVGQKPTTLTGGFNGGGTGCLACTGAGGGGASDIRIGGTSLSDRKVVGGGGGGGGYIFPGYNPAVGGEGGGLTGQKGTDGYGPGGAPGGTQSAGGAAGGTGATAGVFGIGGNGYGRSCGGGGGGGGWYGGGGAYCDGGGGGSSYYDATGNTDKSTQQGVQSGHGKVVIKY